MVRIIAIRVVDRIKESGHTQEVLSRHASVIKSRLGFHELNEDRCSREGYILLYLKNNEKAIDALLDDLDRIYGIEVKHMNLGKEADRPVSVDPGSVISVVGMLISNRSAVVAEVQKTLTSFGCTIRTRLGINEEEQGEDLGLILLELTGEHDEMNKLVNRLNGIGDFPVEVISFN